MQKSRIHLLSIVLCSAFWLGACSSDDDALGAAVPVVVADTTPNGFSFVDQTDVPVSAEITSAAITIAGIDTAAPVSVTGGSYSVDGGAFTAAAGTLTNGSSLRLRHTSAASNSTTASTTVTVGGVSDTFASITIALAGADTTPDAFSIQDQVGVQVGTEITSVAVTITGITSAAEVTVAGGTYSVDCTAPYISTASTISNNQTVCVRHISSANASTATNTTLSVGGVSDIFTSTTAAPVIVSMNSLLPFITGTGDLKLFNPNLPTDGSNPIAADTGLAPAPVGADCKDCFNQAQVFYAGTVAGTTVSNLHASRLVYAKRAIGNDSGGAVFKINITEGAASNLPVRISALTDACAVVETETTDVQNVDNSVVVIERAGADLACSLADDNTLAVIRLNSLITDGAAALVLARDAGTPIHALINAAGAITGYLSFEMNGLEPRLVRRDASLENPVTLLVMGQTTAANIVRADLSHVFVTATPVDESLKLYRLETTGDLSGVLYSFAGFNAGNPLQGGLHDAANLYFSDANMLLRLDLDATTEGAAVITALNEGLRIGNRALDGSTAPDRLVFEAQDDGFTVASGVFSVAVDAAAVAPTTLANYPDSLGGSADLVTVSQGRAYINVTNHGDLADDALKINTDGTGTAITPSAYWAGFSSSSSFDLALNDEPPVQFIILATRTEDGGIGSDTLSVVDPGSGVAGLTLGTVNSAAMFQAVRVSGIGRYALARAEISRFGNPDTDAYALDAMSAASLSALAETDGAQDTALGL